MSSTTGQLAWDVVTSSAVTTVQFGENTLADVAKRVHIDVNALLEVNRNIDPANLTIGQEIRLPMCQKPSMADADAANREAAGRNPLWPDTSAISNVLQHYKTGIVAAYRELPDAHRIYETTGKVPQTKLPYMPIEIKEGRTMTVAERYDAMLRKQGKDYPLVEDVNEDNRDPEYLTQQEFHDEFWKRVKAEHQHCDDEYIRPGKIYKCKEKVNEKYGGSEYKEWRQAGYREAYRQWQHVERKIEAVRNSGVVGLAGRGIGRLIGGEKGEELGGMIGDLGDLGIAVGAARAANLPPAGAPSPGGGEAAHVSSAPVNNIAETQPTRPNAPSGTSKGPVIADTNVVRALDNAHRGVSLNEQDQRVVNAMRDYDVKAAHNAAFEASERGGTQRPFEIAGPVRSTTRAEREAIMHDLQQAGVGSAKDQLIVRQALLNQKPLTFVTGDDGVINGLARLGRIPENRNGMNVSEYLQKVRGTDTFTVTVQGHALTVKPIQKVR